MRIILALLIGFGCGLFVDAVSARSTFRNKGASVKMENKTPTVNPGGVESNPVHDIEANATLDEILRELRKLNFHLEVITENEGEENEG